MNELIKINIQNEINQRCWHNRQRSDRIAKTIVLILAVIGGAFEISSACAQSAPTLTSTNARSGQTEKLTLREMGIWQDEVGEGFSRGTRTMGIEMDATPGMKDCGSTVAHGLALAGLSYGRMIGEVEGEGHWYRGNWEIRAELFCGAQYSPTTEWLVGLTPQLRYNFDTGTRWIPFIDGGVGPTLTGIRRPDLSGTFEFNDQGNIGLQWFVRDNVALTAEIGYLHMSNAGIDHPNNGVNCVTGKVGVSWFF